ncbi:MAG: cytochrome C oxidase subunit IV family protein [Ferruginibacter sp.]|jgi:cytochrome c oxidase subunit 4|nr:cytochrome C oxidase subunit IV family protein [Ferruginibacter sp.]
MSQHTISPEITFAPEHASGTKKIWKTFWILSVITIIELVIGLAIYNIHKGENPSHMLVLFFKGMVCILTLAKAYYIVSIFMHLGDEVRNFIMTIVVPLCLFIWFIIAFLWDGNSWKNLRNTDGGSRPATEQVAPAAIEKGAKP